MADKIFLIDGHSYAYQTFYAIKPLSAPDGSPVNAVYGFTSLLARLLREEDPAAIVAVFDEPRPTFRHELLSTYKATRKPMPPELASQLPLIRAMLEALAIPTLSVPGYEADDVIGTLSRQASEQEWDVLLISKDKDLKQLLGPRIRIFSPKDGAAWGPEELRKEEGLTPAQFLDYLSLTGDDSDNVPGVAGIGPKTALRLIRQFGSLDGLYQALPGRTDLSPKVKEKLAREKEQAYRARHLLTIKQDVPLPAHWQGWKRRTVDHEALGTLLIKLGFKRFLAEFDVAPAAGGDDSRRLQVRTITTEMELREVAAACRKAPLLSLDTETTGLDPWKDRLAGISLAWKEREACYIPLLAPPPAGEKLLSPETVWKHLGPVLASDEVRKTGQNLKFDYLMFREQAGITLGGIHCDTMIAAYLLDPTRGARDLDQLALEFLSYRCIPLASLLGEKKQERTMAEVPLEQAARHAGEDAEVALRLTPVLEARLQGLDLARLFHDIEMPLLPILSEMEHHGIRLDSKVLATMSRDLEKQLEKLVVRAHELAGHEFNLSSPKQLSEILFGKLGLPVVRKTKTGLSTDVEVLEQLAPRHPLPGVLLEHRTLSKLKNTYLDALPDLVQPTTGRLHTSFNQAVTATGRLSSSHPNLQNIPLRTDLGKRIRAAFVADPGHLLLTCDYSQIELRVLAHLSEDPALVAAFQADQDIHRTVAAQVFGALPGLVTDGMRQQAKAVNFGIIYGQTPYGLSRELGIPVGEAKRFIDQYFARYPRVKTYLEGIVEGARREGLVRTMTGRLRPLPDIRSGTPGAVAFAERTAINTVIQGSAADLIKLAMVAIARELPPEKGRLLLQIHDELILEIPEKHLDGVTEMVRERMETILPLRVPLKINGASGPTWEAIT